MDMYNVIEMREKIKNAVSIAEATVREEFISAFKEIYNNNKVPDYFDDKYLVSRVILQKMADLDNIFSGAGFYIILTSYAIDGNDCSLVSGNMRAIYRGECATVKKRVMSHLFNRGYNTEYESRKERYIAKEENKDTLFYEPHWPACLKIQERVNGVNIDDEPYNTDSWLIVVHKMKGSIQEVRVQAELAFDEVFQKPKGSREK